MVVIPISYLIAFLISFGLIETLKGKATRNKPALVEVPTET